MSVKFQKNKIPYLFLVLFALATLYFFNNYAQSEREFLKYPNVPTDKKNVPIELKGATFYITKQESEDHDFNKQTAYFLFIASIIAMGAAYKWDPPPPKV